jgi:hypothetical protein
LTSLLESGSSSHIRKASHPSSQEGRIRSRQSEGQAREDAKRGRLTVIVPAHRELACGTLASILRQAGLSAKEFIELL